MKKTAFLLVFICSCFVMPISIEAQPDRDHICKISGWEAGTAARKVNFQYHGMADSFDVVYHRIHWNIDPNVRAIAGAVQTQFKALNSISSLHFDLHSVLTVDSVTTGGMTVPFTHQANGILSIQLPGVVNPGTTDSVKIYYHGIPPIGSGAFNQSTHNGQGVIWTLSEPYGAMEWWPCKQDLEDKADSVDIFITIPSGNKAGSNGSLEGVQNLPGNEVRYHWKHRYPIPAYLVAVAVTNYVEFSDYAQVGNDSLRILNYVYPEDSNAMQQGFAAAVPLMELYDTLLEPYPYMAEKYGHAQTGIGGGMEHATMSFMGFSSFGLVAHELVHQWFGDKVTCGSWEDIWLNEGFATYFTGVSYEHMFGPSVWRQWILQTRANVLSQPGGSVMVTDTNDVSRIFNGRLSYDKGAMLLHMLRWKLGDADLYQGIRNYLSDPDLAYSFAVTEDLKHHLEQASGQNLTEFFNDWYVGEGYPIYQVEWGQVADSLFVSIDQTSSHPSVNFFEMPVPISFTGVAGDTSYVFDHQFDNQSFQRRIKFKADSVYFDPDLWLLAEVAAITKVIGLSEEDPNAVEVFPNPAQAYFVVDGCWKRLELRDQRGRLLLEKSNDIQNCEATRIKIESMAAGMYLLNIDGSTKKLMIGG